MALSEKITREMIMTFDENGNVTVMTLKTRSTVYQDGEEISSKASNVSTVNVEQMVPMLSEADFIRLSNAIEARKNAALG